MLSMYSSIASWSEGSIGRRACARSRTCCIVSVMPSVTTAPPTALPIIARPCLVDIVLAPALTISATVLSLNAETPGNLDSTLKRAPSKPAWNTAAPAALPGSMSSGVVMSRASTCRSMFMPKNDGKPATTAPAMPPTTPPTGPATAVPATPP